jgi:hypothetical protein
MQTLLLYVKCSTLGVFSPVTPVLLLKLEMKQEKISIKTIHKKKNSEPN